MTPCDLSISSTPFIHPTTSTCIYFIIPVHSIRFAPVCHLREFHRSKSKSNLFLLLIGAEVAAAAARRRQRHYFDASSSRRQPPGGSGVAVLVAPAFGSGRQAASACVRRLATRLEESEEWEPGAHPEGKCNAPPVARRPLMHPIPF